MKLPLKDLSVKSFVTAMSDADDAVKGGTIGFPKTQTQIPCSAIDACPTGYCPFPTLIC